MSGFRGTMCASEISEHEKGSFLLVHPDYQDKVTSEWFVPTYWGARALPVSVGGRGGAWFINTGDSRVVLREYRRGGLAARISRKTYVYTSEQNVRSVAEFHLLDRLVSKGLPVPRPVAAWYRKVSPVQYQAAIIIERLEGTKPLAELVESLADLDWFILGQTVRRFHDARVRHADLNCFNVLVRGQDFFLIDFDKGRIMPPNSSSRWKAANLDRFARSLRKVAGDAVMNRVWGAFLNGYNGREIS